MALFETALFFLSALLESIEYLDVIGLFNFMYAT